MRDNDCSGSNTFFAFLLGGAIGAGLALLLAPQSGRETRQRIRDYAGDVRDKAEDIVEDAKSSARSAVDKGKEYVKEKKSIMSSAIEAGKDAYDKEKERHVKES